jgi:prevent-host-death family protein
MNNKNIISATEARKNLFSIIEKVSSPDTFFTLTEHGKAKAVIMSSDEFESWTETLELLYMFPNIKKEIAEAKKEIAQGKYITYKEFKNKYL